MSYLIKDLPSNEKPRERLMLYGVEALSNEELLSILLRCGTKNKSVKELSFDILRSYDVHDLANINYKTLAAIKGVGIAKSLSILAALELGKRSISKSSLVLKIRSSLDVYDLVRYDMKNELQEKMICLYLNNRKELIQKKILFIGTVNQSNVYPRDIFREAVKNNASFLILVHNHPGGSIVPSYQDTIMTNEMIKIGRLMGIFVLDHLIIGREGFYSYLEKQGELFEKENERSS